MTNLLFLVLGAVLSLVVAAIVSYQQFERSQANYRFRRVKDATKKIVQELKSNNSDTSPIRNNYRYSLGVVIDRMASTFGTTGKKGIPKREEKFPGLIDSEGDRWCFFNEYIRPVISDLNSNNLFAILFWLPKFKNFRTLVLLCEKIEGVVGTLDSIRQIEQGQKCKILDFKNALEIHETDQVNINFQIQDLKNQYTELNDLWQNWVKQII